MPKTRLGLLLLTASVALAQQYVISTIAGGAPPPLTGFALSTPLAVSGAVGVDASGNVYFTSGSYVLKVDPAGTLSRVAGTNKSGTASDGIPATSAPLAWPAGLAVDRSGNLYIAENAAHRIRKVSPDGIITTVAGTGTAGLSGDGGPALSAQLNWPVGIAIDGSGNLYIADTANLRVRKVSADGIITTLTTNLNHAEGVAVDASGSVYIADYETTYDGDCLCDIPHGLVFRAGQDGSTQLIAGGGADNGDGGSAISARLETPRGIAVDEAGNVFVSDTAAGRVRKISPDGIITTAAGGRTGYYFTEYCSRIGADLACPVGVAADASGNLYIADTVHNQVKKVLQGGTLTAIAGDGTVRTFSGDGGPATSASLDHPYGIAMDASGNLYIADTYNSRIRKVSSDGIIATIAGDGSPIPAPGCCFSDQIGDGGPAVKAKIRQPTGVAIDMAGALYITDIWAERIRKVSLDGIITTVAGDGGVEPPGATGVLATSARLGYPWAVSVAADASFYFSDIDGLKKVSANGILTSVTAHPNQIGGGVALDAAGNVYAADISAGRVQKIAPDGTVSTVPGSEGTFPVGVAVDAAGALYIAEARTNRIRKVFPDGSVATIAGNGFGAYSGDGGSATSASLSYPTAVAVDATGRVYVADTDNSVIRLLQPVAQ
jgi:sugar lactone lactonase YvrE